MFILRLRHLFITPFSIALVLIGLLFVLPLLLNSAGRYLGWSPYSPADTPVAPLFTPQVQHWGADIVRWAAESRIDPNLLATIMQIESCGHPTVSSPAGAQGLFQVMPFHFDTGEDMLDPNTNAFRSTNFINECSTQANGHYGLVMACYNGGQQIFRLPMHQWPAETQRYYRWGVGIYIDARQSAHYSPTLDNWLRAGGVHLCNRAENAIQQYKAQAN